MKVKAACCVYYYKRKKLIQKYPRGDKPLVIFSHAFSAREGTACASLRRRLKVPCDKVIIKVNDNFTRHFAPTL